MTLKRKNAPWMPAAYGLPEVAAIQALLRGDASEGQQQKALQFIVETLCGTYDQPYSPDETRDTDFSCGKMFVGQQIVKMTKINLEAMKEQEKTHGRRNNPKR